MRTRKTLPALALLLALALVTAACSGGDSTGSDEPAPQVSSDVQATGLLKQVLDSGKLRVSTDPAYPPQSELNPKTNQYEGFDIDVATEIANRLGVEVEWVTPSWDLITAGGWNDRWDISVGSMTVTPEREEVLHFSPPYYYTPAVAMVHADNTTITDPTTDLDGKTVGVCGGCTYDFYLQGTLEIPGEDIEFQIDDPSIKTYDTDSTAIQDLTLGDGARVDAVITSATTAQAAVDKGKPVKIVGEPLFYEPLAVALDRKASEDPAPLLEAISEIVDEMHADGTLAEMSNKWFGQDLATKIES